MSLLYPAALGWMVASLVVLVLYLLRPSRQPRQVSTLWLWREVVREVSGSILSQRLRWSWLLLLQLAATVALTLLLARPYLPQLAPPHLIVLVDLSASMLATDVEPSRLEQAKRMAAQLVQERPEGDLFSLIAVSDRAVPLLWASPDRGEALRIVGEMAPTAAGTNLEEGLRLASTLARRYSPSQVYILTDGATQPPSQEVDIPATVRVIPLGHPVDNLAITRMVARSETATATAPQLLLEISNPGDSDAEGRLLIYADDKLVEVRKASLPAHSRSTMLLSQFPPETRLVRARLEPEDALSQDNVALAVAAPVQRRALLVARELSFLSKALAVLPHVAVEFVRPEDYRPGPYDIYIFDGWLPSRLPPGSHLVINPPSEVDWLTIAGNTENPQPQPDNGDPLLSQVDFSAVRISQARQVQVPNWARQAVAMEGGSLVFRGRYQGQRMVVVTFDLEKSNLPVLADFPVFLDNVLEWLSPASPEAFHLRPGDKIAVQPIAGGRRVRIQKPDGTEVVYDRAQPTLFADTQSLGRYTLLQETASGRVLRTLHFTVQWPDARESDLSVPEGIRATLEREAPPNANRGQAVGWELFSALGMVAVALLAGEWWWAHHRGD